VEQTSVDKVFTTKICRDYAIGDVAGVVESPVRDSADEQRLQALDTRSSVERLGT
jgi:hypothetical protein